MRQKDGLPFMIFISLLGIRRRWQAWFFVWLCILLGAAMTALAIAVFTRLIPMLPLDRSSIGAFSIISALTLYACAGWYWYALRWVDKNEGWE